MTPREKTWTLPVLPLRNTVLFPYALVPLSVGRERSVAAVEAAVAKTDSELVIIAQRDGSQEEPGWEDLYRVGTRAVLRKVVRNPEGALEVLVQGLERVQVVEELKEERFHQAKVRAFPLAADQTVETEALRREVLELARKALSFVNVEAAAGLATFFQAAAEPERMVYGLASMLNLEAAKEQALLEARTFGEALRLLHEYLSREVQILQVRHEIARHAQTEISREQREYLLRQQLKAIREELGEKSPEEAELALLRERLAKAELPEPARREVERELSRLERLPTAAAEYHVIRSYVDFVLDLPWNRLSESRVDLALARRVLDEDHFDLKDVKDRILEQLAVLKLNPGARAPILCFVGPPGVGKTSLGQSIARALGRAFERTSLGGLHDEAELRGHRRTYIGAMPGRILQALRRAGVRNPVLMLDEVDKIGQDFRGDPAAALLEILDPAQNSTFRDNYLDLPFDLSQVFFITTANRTDTIPGPLLDRMEVLRLAGYSEEEKLEIARRYLIPRQIREAGLPPDRLNLADEALRYIVSRYTREAGVRQLERAIGRLARKVAREVVEDPSRPPRRLGAAEVRELLGREIVFPEEIRKDLPPGVAPGLAWTETGGEVLYVEAVRLPDRKDLLITGQVGPVMQESAQAALSFIQAHANRLDIDRSLLRKAGVHVHVPAGAIPKDGPSAGVTIAAALASLFTGRPCRSDTAMTGEITLTGLVFPVGGIKEKVLAARRAGLGRVILPRQNEPDLRELPDEVRAGMTFIPVDRIEDVLAEALAAEPAADRAEAARVRRGKVA